MLRGDPLLKAGVILMGLALTLAVAAAVVSVMVREEPERAVASERASRDSGVEPLVRSDPPGGAWVEKVPPQPQPQPEPPRAQAQPDPEPEAEPEPEKPEPEPRLQPRPQREPERERESLPVEEADWPEPTREELAAVREPRRYNIPDGAIMGLTIGAIGIHNAPVYNSDSEWALDNGVSHDPQTSLPWSNTPQRNVYLAGHRLGYQGTWSRLIFYELDKLREGDEVVLKDREGKAYRYRVSEVFVVDPEDVWVMGQVADRDMVTLQTCTPIPAFDKRLIVRADRV